jgi:hypothetical protein
MGNGFGGLVKFEGNVVILPRSSRFVFAGSFREDMSSQAPVKIFSLADGTKKRFSGFIEEPGAGLTLRYGRLQQSASNFKITEALGGYNKMRQSAQATFSSIFSLMERHAAGEEGILLTDSQAGGKGPANIFYIFDEEILKLASIRLINGGWSISDYDADDGCNVWFAGSRIFNLVS